MLGSSEVIANKVIKSYRFMNGSIENSENDWRSVVTKGGDWDVVDWEFGGKGWIFYGEEDVGEAVCID